MNGEFVNRFNFDREKHLFVGVERECFLLKSGRIAPIAPTIISKLKGHGNYGYELSACQLEIRTNPTPIETVPEVLIDSDRTLEIDQVRLGFEILHQEVAPFDMPLDVYPDPSGRYQQITKDMPKEILRAACRVAGTHVHIGMGSPEQAIRAYNAVIERLPELCKMGDKSHGERLEIYKIMAPNFQPPHYDDWNAYEQYAMDNKFWDGPRNCWHLIRISIHGTIEFRVFGATPDILDVVSWAIFCHSICKEAS